MSKSPQDVDEVFRMMELSVIEAGSLLGIVFEK